MMKPAIHAVLFDLGGVILRTDDRGPRQALAESVGRTYAELDEIVFGNPAAQLAERGQASPEQVWEEIGRLLQLSPQQIPGFRRAFFDGDRVDAALVDWIASLRGAYRTGLLSNTWFKDLERFLREDLQIGDVFDVVISSARSGRAKPDAKIFHEALAALGVQAAETVFVDDNQANIEAANRLGFQTVRFLNASQARADLEALLHNPGRKPEAGAVG